MQRFTPLLIDAARPTRHLAGDRWLVDETYVKVSGVWSYVYRAVDQHGQVIDVYVSRRRDIASARTFFTAALALHGDPGEVITDRALALANVIEDLLPAAGHNTGQYQNNRVECDRGRLKARPMRGVKTNRTASGLIRGHAFIQNLRRVVVESAPQVMGCPTCGVVVYSHGRRDVRLVDVPCFGRPVELIWRKRTWRCGEPSWGALCPASGSARGTRHRGIGTRSVSQRHRPADNFGVREYATHPDSDDRGIGWES